MNFNTKIKEVSKNTLIAINKTVYRTTGVKNGNKYQVIEITRRAKHIS